ncbi:superoxide dismutase [Larkinella soli]|uniref:superoxide dismutase n=1 Tax=Larkinella soli TaxID=1770527 RepID=UPI001E630BA1|nr:superoxide dismutase [Larkinella soli]
MMNRQEFFQKSALITGAALLTGNDVFSAGLAEGGMDRLTDATGKYVLGPLPYADGFLEPFMPADILKLHYTAHHGGAVNTANKATDLLKTARETGNFEGVDYWTKKLSLHLSSHVLHTIFWTNLTNRKTEPKGELLRRIEKDFGTFDKMKAQLAHHSKNVDGNGWGLLGYHPQSDRLHVLEVENHEKLTVWGIVPLMVVDVWEHAYYLKYKNKRTDFVDELFSYMNWDNAAQRLETGLKISK